jgi:hypothetical protein
MTRLRFTTLFESDQLRGIQLPLEIRTADLALVAAILTSDSIDLKPGMYVVAAKLPAGHEIKRVIEVGAVDETIDLMPPKLKESAIEVATFLASKRAQLADVRAAATVIAPAVGAGIAAVVTGLNTFLTVGIGGFSRSDHRPAGRQAFLRGFIGNPLLSTVEEVDLQAKEIARAKNVVQYHVAPARKTMYLQSLQPGRPAVNIALPLSERAGCVIAAHSEPGRVWVEVHADHGEANLLAGYQQSSEGSDQTALAERLLRGKLDDPIAALIAAYSLIRSGHLDLLHDWTADLLRDFPWLPDATAARGEHLARLGLHQEALEVFVGLPGLPLFSDGIGYVWERLRLYCSLREQFPAPVFARAEALRDQLGRFISFINFDLVVTTFTGADPASPDASTLTDLPKHGPGLWV